MAAGGFDTLDDGVQQAQGKISDLGYFCFRQHRFALPCGGVRIDTSNNRLKPGDPSAA